MLNEYQRCVDHILEGFLLYLLKILPMSYPLIDGGGYFVIALQPQLLELFLVFHLKFSLGLRESALGVLFLTHVRFG